MAESVFRDGKWCVEIRFPVYKHSHLVSQSQFENYSQNRQVPQCEPILDDIRLMIRVGGKCLRIYNYIRNHSKYKVTMKDVYNLVSRIRGEIRGEASDDVATAEFLLAFNEADPGNVSSVDESDTGDTGAISLTTSHMRRMFRAFPELLMVDCTHKTNRYDYQLCSLMVMDSFGAGQFVQHSIIEINSDWHLHKVVDHLKSANASWGAIQVIMVDKDMKEIDVLLEEFPNAHILLCHFHVLKYLRGIAKDSKYGRYSRDEYESFGHLFHNLVYAGSEGEFDVQKELLRKLSCARGNTTFWEYFRENWVASTGMWTSYGRARLPHFRNHTNNRLESNFGKLKLNLESSATMKECLEVLMQFQARSENEYHAQAQYEGTWRDVHYPPDLNLLLQISTPWAAENVKGEYDFALSVDARRLYHFSENNGICTISSPDITKPKWQDRSTPLETRDKYVVARRVVDKLVQELTDLPSSRFQNEIRFLENYVAGLRINVFTPPPEVLVPTGDEATTLLVSDIQAVPPTSSDTAAESNVVLETKMPVPTEDSQRGCRSEATLQQFAPDNKLRLNLEKDIHDPPSSTSPLEEQERPTNDKNVSASKQHPQIKLNRKVRRAGRPKADPKARAKATAAFRKKFNQQIKATGDIAGEDVVIVECKLSCRDRSLLQVHTAIETIPTKHVQAANKIPKIGSDKNPVLSACIMFLLPEKLVKKAIKTIYDKTEVIDLSDSSETSSNCQSDVQNASQPYVRIAGLGNYTLKKLNAMQELYTLRETCKRGVPLISWLQRECSDDPRCENLVQMLQQHHPYALVEGFEAQFLDFSHVYRIAPGFWLSEASFRALEIVWSYYNVEVVTLPVMERDTITCIPDDIALGISSSTATWTFIPVNLGRNHWVAIAINRSANKVYVYDSFSVNPNKGVLHKVVMELQALSTLMAFEIEPITGPQQRDSYSCGMFVAQFFWKFLESPIEDKTDNDLRHFRLRVTAAFLT